MQTGKFLIHATIFRHSETSILIYTKEQLQCTTIFSHKPTEESRLFLIYPDEVLPWTQLKTSNSAIHLQIAAGSKTFSGKKTIAMNFFQNPGFSAKNILIFLFFSTVSCFQSLTDQGSV